MATFPSTTATITTKFPRRTKRTHIAPTKKTVTSKGVTELFFDNVFKYHGWPKEVVSDRDTRLTASFWSDLATFTGTKLNMSTANHPQTDGQTERANRTIIEALRAYVSVHQTDWENHLTAIEFAYNESDHAGTGFSPFYLEYGYHPLTPTAIAAGAPSARPTNVPAVLKHLH